MSPTGSATPVSTAGTPTATATAANAPAAPNTIDRILAMLDNALEQPTSAHNGCGSMVPASVCWRCQDRKTVGGGTMCGPCGAYLRCETDYDPAPPPPPETAPVPTWDQIHYYGWWFEPGG